MKKLILCACLAGVVFTSCKKETVEQNSNNVSQKKAFFYLEEVSKTGEVSKTPIVVVNVPAD